VPPLGAACGFGVSFATCDLRQGEESWKRDPKVPLYTFGISSAEWRIHFWVLVHVHVWELHVVTMRPLHSTLFLRLYSPAIVVFFIIRSKI
jgi:hypothetical protein